MTRFFDATFEGASLTGASGASSVTGTVTLDNTSKIIGTYSSKHDTASSFLRFNFSSSTTIYVSALLYVTTFSANIRTIYITNVARIDIRSNGALTFRWQRHANRQRFINPVHQYPLSHWPPLHGRQWFGRNYHIIS